MKLFDKRHFSTTFLPSLLNPSRQTCIIELCKLGFLSKAIKLLNSTPSTEITIKPVVYATFFQTCVKANSFNLGLQFHSHVIKYGLDSVPSLGNSLLSMYFRLSPDIADTHKVFDHLSLKDVISWTSIITGYVQAGMPNKSIHMFWEMLDFGVVPNAFTLSSTIKAASELRAINIGVCVHGVVLRRGFVLSTVIVGSLIDMYGSNSCLNEARRLFDELPVKDLVCWNAVMTALIQNDHSEGALELFYLINKECNLILDECTFGTVLTACGRLGRVKQGKQMHGKIIASGIRGDLVVESSLLDMYGKCGLVEDSRVVFNHMPKKNVVSWCALLGAYCHNGEFKAVLELFREMETKAIYSFGTVLRACAGLAVVRQGQEVHCHYLRKWSRGNVIVESALVDLYAKCGFIDYAERVFSDIPVRNLVAWNSMISGFAQNGRPEEALRIFSEMLNKGIKPDRVTFVSVLFACSHAGFVDQGRKYFMLMDGFYKINAGIEHYNCMVDLLSRAGLLEEAEDLLQRSDFKDNLPLWAAIFGACTSYSNLAVAERVAKKMMELEPYNPLSYVLLANVYGACGQWDGAANLRKLMKDRGVKKMPGKSWIDIKNKGFLRFEKRWVGNSCTAP